jgi:hypothetical protein
VWRANKMSGFVARDLSGFILSQEVTEYETDRMATGDSEDAILLKRMRVGRRGG